MEKIDLNKIHPSTAFRASKIHFIGIGGIGLSAIAKLMLARGKTVSGSDINKSEITDELENLGAKIFIGQRAENLAKDIELVIYTLAIPENNSELAKARQLKIPLLNYPEALGKIFNHEDSGYGIAVCGTHGKSTTASMAGLVLAGGGLDPSVMVGSKVPEFGGNLRAGNGKYFVIEACEYERAFLEYWPKIIVLNNIELDHTDYYKDIDDYRGAFEEFINHLPPDGLLIFNGDGVKIPNYETQTPNKSQIPNPKLQKKFNTLSFGFGENNDLRCRKMETGEGQTRFWTTFKGGELGEFTLKIPGKFNVYNALAAITVGLHLGVGVEKIKKTVANFGGIWRRFEIKGEYRGATVVSDYAHHPTAIKATIGAAREFYPGKRIVAVFQPHQHNRTKMLYQDFLKSFDSADLVILAEIFDVAGREEKNDQNVSSQNLAEDITLRRSDFAKAMTDKQGCGGQEKSIFYGKNLDETRKLIDEKIKTGDVVLIMGAGDIYKVADKLATR